MNLPSEQLDAVVSFLKCEAFDCLDDLAGASCFIRSVASATFGPIRGRGCCSNALCMDVGRCTVAAIANGT